MIIKYFITSSRTIHQYEICTFWQFFSRTLQYFSWTLQVFSGRLQVFSGSLQVFSRRLQVFSRRLQVFSGSLQVFFRIPTGFYPGFLQVFISISPGVNLCAKTDKIQLKSRRIPEPILYCNMYSFSTGILQ